MCDTRVNRYTSNNESVLFPCVNENVTCENVQIQYGDILSFRKERNCRYFVVYHLDSTPPVLRYASQPPKVSNNRVTFKWTSTESATFECSLDDISKVVPCGSGTTGQKELFDLPKGRRLFWVRGTDKAGNVGSFVPHLWSVGK